MSTATFEAAQAWGPYDLKASWVAIFLLLILWWLSFIPLMFYKRTSKEEGVTTESAAGLDDETEKYQRIARHFRDGLLFLLAAITITVIAAGPVGTTNALAWVFTSIWIILGLLMFFFKWRRVLTLLAFLDLVLLIALISRAFAAPAVRSRIITP